MEKQRADRFAYRRIRLLIHRIILTIAIVSLFSANVVAQNFFSDEQNFSYDAHQFFIEPESQNIFVGDEVVFSVFIPDVLSADTQFLSPDFGDGVNFLILRSFDYFVQGRRGVRVEVKLSFNRDGNFQLPPIVMVFRGEKYDVPFKNFYVAQNVDEAMPAMSVRFELASDGRFLAEVFNDASYSRAIFAIGVGAPINVKVSLQNSKKMERLSWVLPEHSIFSQISQHEKSATFEWIPLMAGEEQLPLFTIIAAANDGNTIELRSPAATVNVTASSSSGVVDDNMSATSNNYITSGGISLNEMSFPNAFSQDTANSEIQQTSQMTREECEELAASLLKEKKHYRIAMNIFVAAAVFALALLVYLIIFIKKRNRTVAIVATVVIFAVSCIGAIFCAPRAMSRTGVFLGGNVSAVPENVSAQSVFLDAGQIVHVMKSAGGWSFIKCDMASGWVLTESLLEI